MLSKVYLKAVKASALFVALFLFIVISPACSKKSDEVLSLNNGTGYVSFINAVPGSVPQDILVDGIRMSSQALRFTQSSGYQQLKQGAHRLRVLSSTDSTLSASSTFSVTSPKYYSIFYAYDKTFLYVDDDRTPPKPGKYRIRFVDLTPALNTIDIGISTAKKLAVGLENKTYSPYYDVDPGTSYYVYSGGSVIILTEIAAKLEAGHLYTAYLTGSSSAAVRYSLLTQDP